MRKQFCAHFQKTIDFEVDGAQNLIYHARKHRTHSILVSILFVCKFISCRRRHRFGKFPDVPLKPIRPRQTSFRRIALPPIPRGRFPNSISNDKWPMKGLESRVREVPAMISLCGTLSANNVRWENSVYSSAREIEPFHNANIAAKLPLNKS